MLKQNHHAIILSSAIIFCLSLIFAGCSSKTETVPIEEASPSPTPIASPAPGASPLPTPSVSSVVTPYEEDATELIEYVERTHPAFLLKEVSEDYYKEKEAYLEAAKNELSPFEFSLLTNKYLASLHDFNTRAYFPLGNQVLTDYDNCISLDDSLVMLDENEQPTKKKIIQIGGKSISEIFEAVDTYFPSDNASNYNLYYDCALYKDFLEYIGCTIQNNKTKVIFEENNIITEEELPFIELKDSDDTSVSISSKWIDDENLSC